MIKLQSRLKLFLLIFVFTFLPFQSAFAVSLSPAIIEEIIAPGKSQENTIKVTNPDKTSKTFYISIQNFEPQGETGTPYFTTSDEDLAKWIKIDTQVTIAPNSTIEVPYEIKVPTFTQPGGYFAAIFFGTQPPEDTVNPLEKDSQVSIGGKVGSLVLLRVAGKINEKGGIVEFGSETGSKLFPNLPINFFFRFNNDGGDRVAPKGNLTFYNSLGFKSDELKVNENLSNVLPGSIRKFSLVWGENELKESNFISTLKHQLSNFRFGFYTAVLDLEWGFNQDKTGSEIYKFFVFPWQLMTVFFILLFGGFLLIKVYNKWIISNALKAVKLQMEMEAKFKKESEPEIQPTIKLERAKKKKPTKKPKPEKEDEV